MKILFNTYPTAFQNSGGGEVIILKLKEYLERMGHVVDLFNQWEHKISDYDLVHEFSLLNWRNWNYYKMLQKPMVLTPTSWMRTSNSYRWKYFAKEKFKIMMSKNNCYPSLINEIQLPDIICPTTNLEAQRLINFFGEKIRNKTKVINNGVDLINEHQIDTSEFLEKYKPQENFLLYVGSIRPNKNIEIAIKMAKAVEKQIFIIGGYSEEFSDYYQKIKQYENKDVVFTGFIPNGSKTITAAFKLASAVIIPSDFETCSLVALEAGFWGTPSFITKHGGTKEIYKEHATYIDPKNLNQCLDIIKSTPLQKDYDLQKFIKDNYSWEKITQQYLRAYETILS